MPWKVKNPMDLRADFVQRLKRGERMTDLCAEYGISRKTGHKIWNRYQDKGVAGLVDESRAPKTIPHRTGEEVVELVEVEPDSRHAVVDPDERWGHAVLADCFGELARQPFALPLRHTVQQERCLKGHVSRPGAIHEVHAWIPSAQPLP